VVQEWTVTRAIKVARVVTVIKAAKVDTVLKAERLLLQPESHQALNLLTRLNR
jgi:hypothetical protein